MRIVEQIPHSAFNITLFSTEKDFIVKLEAGPMEQTYKLGKDLFETPADVKNYLSAQFIDKAHDLFNEMFLNRQSMVDAIKKDKLG